MQQSTLLHLSVLFILLISALCSSTTTSLKKCTKSRTQRVRIGFWLSSSEHYHPLSKINTKLYTHLCYSHLSLDASGTHVALPKSRHERSRLRRFSNTLKSRDPHLKTLVSISSNGQFSDTDNSSNIFSTMASNQKSRASFIKSAIDHARNYKFDGFDFSWQFPSTPSDMTNLGLLLQEWRSKIVEKTNNTNKSSPELLLTASVYFSGHVFDSESGNLNYPIQAMSANLNWVNDLSFGYNSHGKRTAADSRLYNVHSHFSTSYSVTSWLDSGLPPCKLVIGIPLYGRSWLLKNKKKSRIGTKVVSAGSKQKHSNQTGILAYFEMDKSLKDPDAKLVYDNKNVLAYYQVRNIWVSFDNPQVVEAKIRYIQQKELLGYFLWPISFDMNNTISKLGWYKYSYFVLLFYSTF